MEHSQEDPDRKRKWDEQLLSAGNSATADEELHTGAGWGTCSSVGRSHWGVRIEYAELVRANSTPGDRGRIRRVVGNGGQ